MNTGKVEAIVRAFGVSDVTVKMCWMWVMSQELVSENAGIVAAKALNIDAGCCCGLNTWRHDVKDRCVGQNAQTTVEEILRVIYRG